MKQKLTGLISTLLAIAAIIFSINFLLNYTGITITIGKQQKPEIYTYPQGSQEQRL